MCYSDQVYLQQALAAAQQRQGYCAPNPAVGAVIVDHDQVIATGTHWAAGHPHAEVEAIGRAGAAAKKATLYVTLEPCAHYGKTPPCIDAILRSGLRRVVFGCRDPHHSARHGQQALLAAGIICDFLPIPEITEFYRSYLYWLVYQRPWVTLKLAVSADGKIAAAGSKPIAITGEDCYRLTQQHRYRSDGLLTTLQTIVCDDPRMNARLSDKTVAKPLFVLDSHLQLSCHATVFKTAKSITVYYREGITPRMDIDCVAVPYDESGLDLIAVLADIGRRGVHDLWIEVGARAFHSFYKQRLANRVVFYRSPKSLGNAAVSAFNDIDPFAEHELHWQPLGEDMLAQVLLD